MAAHDQILDLEARMQRSIIGREEVIERLIIGLPADGDLLVEGLPGLDKCARAHAMPGCRGGSSWRRTTSAPSCTPCCGTF